MAGASDSWLKGSSMSSPVNHQLKVFWRRVSRAGLKSWRTARTRIPPLDVPAGVSRAEFEHRLHTHTDQLRARARAWDALFSVGLLAALVLIDLLPVRTHWAVHLGWLVVGAVGASWFLLRLIRPRGRRMLDYVYRDVGRMPAWVVGYVDRPDRVDEYLRTRLPTLAEREIAESLAEEFSGRVDDLVRAARALA
jgi:hypothetical protein